MVCGQGLGVEGFRVSDLHGQVFLDAGLNGPRLLEGTFGLLLFGVESILFFGIESILEGSLFGGFS